MRDLAARLNIAIATAGERKLEIIEKLLNADAGAAKKLNKEYGALNSASQKYAAGLRALTAAEQQSIKYQLESAKMAQRSSAAAEKAAAREAAAAEKLALKNKKGGGVGGAFRDFLDIGSKMMVVGYGISRVFKMIGNFAAGSMKPVIDFSAAMAQVQIKGGFDKAQTATLSQAAMRLGRTSIFTPLEGAQAQESLAASGLTPEQIIKNMPTVKKFAIAGGLETHEASDALVNVARQFGMDLNDPHSLERVGSTLVKAANVSTISVRDLLQTMKYSGKPGEVSGYQVEDVAGMAAIVGNSGIRGSMGGTGMRNMFSSFAKPKGGKHTDAFLAMLGLSRKDVENGLEHIPEFLQMLQKKMDNKGFSRQKRVGLAASLFGQYGMTAAMVLQKAAGTQVEGFGNQIAETIAKIKGSSNELENAFNIRMDTPQAKLDALNARWETLKITIGEAFLPAMEGGLGRLSGALEELTLRMNNDPEFLKKIEGLGTALEHVFEIIVGIDERLYNIPRRFEAITSTVGGWFGALGGTSAGGIGVPLDPANDPNAPNQSPGVVKIDDMGKTYSDEGDMPGLASPSDIMSRPQEQNMSRAPSLLDINISVDPGAQVSIKKLKPSQNQHIRVSRNMATH